MKHRFDICRICMACLVSLVIGATHAQTADELLKQKETRRKYALLEIAQWKLYANYLQKGIAIAGKGLNTIQQVKSGNWKLDENFFEQLINPSGTICQLADLDNMKRYPVIILRQKQQIRNYMKNHSDQFSDQEVNHISEVISSLEKECINNLETLTQLTRQQTFNMSDEARSKKISALVEDMKKQLAYTRIIVNGVKNL